MKRNTDSKNTSMADVVPYLGLLGAKRVQMSKDLTETTLTIWLNDDDEKLAAARKDCAGKSLGASIFDSRLDKDAEIDDMAWFFIVYQCGTPGVAVMFAYTVSLLSWLLCGEKITSDMLMTHPKVFAYGVPDVIGEDCDGMRVWDSQKRFGHGPGHSDNWLDDKAFWEANKGHFLNKGLAFLPDAATFEKPRHA